LKDLLDKNGGRWKRRNTRKAGHEQRLEYLWNTDRKEEYTGRAGQEQRLENLFDKDGGRWKRKSTGRAGQEQSLEDLLGKKGADEKGGVQGKQHRSRDWKICWIRLGEDGKEQYKRAGQVHGIYVEIG
jgi:hypothetical protein